MRIYGDGVSGNCLKVKWVCDKLAVPHEWIQTDVVKRETRTPEFLAINPVGQVPVVQFNDGRVLAQSNAIIRFLARNSDLIPQDAFDTAKMDEWLFWAQYNHEPYIAVARFQIAFLGKSPSDLNPDLFTRGYAALQRMDDVLRGQDFLVACGFSLADIALVAYTRMAQEENFDLTRYPAVQRWIGVVEEHLGLDPYITMTGS